MWLLTIEDYEGLTTFHRLTGDRYTLGRAPDNDFVLAQLDVSRRQGRLERRGESWVYVDEGSALGSYVDCGLVEAHAPVPLQDGAVVQFSDYVLHFTQAELEGAPTPAPRYVEPARLRALTGPIAGAEHVFGRSELVTIGRADECTLTLVHEHVSLQHALIRPLGDGRHELVDTSDNGLLFVNGRRLEWAEHVLEGGDAINIGGVALFRYLEASQRPGPRFDDHWNVAESDTEAAAPRRSALDARAPSDDAGEARPEHRVEAEGPVSSDDAGKAPPEQRVEAVGPVSSDAAGEAPPEQRIEAVGPVPLPAPRPPSASFLRLRQATIGHGVRGPVVLERGHAAGASTPSVDVSTWYAGAPTPAVAAPEPSSPRPGGTRAGAAERYPSGLTLAAPTRPSKASETAVPPPKADARPEEPGAPDAGRKAPPPVASRRPNRLGVALFWATVLSIGVFGGSKLAAITLERERVAAIDPPAFTPSAASTPVGAELSTTVPPLPTALDAASAVSGAVAPRPSGSAPALPPTGRSGAGASRSALEARVRGGRASAREAQELLALCQRDGDARCMSVARAALRGPGAR